jgi:hypothetical protein
MACAHGQLDEDEKVYFAVQAAACDFGEACAKFGDDNRYPDVVPLNNIIHTLMTELWDRSFSQTEIRLASKLPSTI